MNKSILVTQSSMPLLDEYVDRIKDIWDNRWLTNKGKFHQEFEAKLIEYLDISNVSLFTNGHMALEVGIESMNLTGEVITTPFTYASTTQAIVRNRLTPVFCDINEDDYTIDVNKIEELITDKTSAIIPVHVYGNACNVDEIDKIAKKYNLKVIYDAAHSFGEVYNGRGIASYGDASMFSFHATKVFHTIEGGAFTYNDDSITNKLEKLKCFGIESEEVVDEIGTNAKMNEFQAAMGLCNLEHIEEEIAKRKKVVERYRKRLRNVKGIKIVEEQAGLKSNYAYFPVLFNKEEFGFDRDDVCNVLANNNIFARKYFYPLTSSFECYKGKFDINETPVAKYVSENILTLPLYADLLIEEVDKICDIIINMKNYKKQKESILVGEI